jgi:Na+-translocating ferredoxin:NAD+ oxidoreductase subunit C
LLSKTFKGGVHPKGYKELSKNSAIRRISMPAQVIIPLIQHIGAPCYPVVKPGDVVCAGSLIADSQKLISAPIHSSVSGTVKAIKKTAHPVLGSCESVIIDSDGQNKKAYTNNINQAQLDSLSPEQIKDKIRSCGIVGMGGAGFPTHVKLSPPKDKHIDTFILNGAECEPYLTCDDRMMQERADGILKGMLLLMKAIGLSFGVIAIEDNKPEAIRAMRAQLEALSIGQHAIRIIKLPVKYPQGGEKQLIKVLTGREVPPLKLPFEVGCIVDNTQTAYAVYEAIYKNKPLYERAVTVTGDAVKNPSNLIVGIGTPVSYVIEQCGGTKEDIGRLIIGGPMMGTAQFTSDIPVIKGVSGILVLGREYADYKKQDYCIRCGKCKESCPAHLIPTDIAKAAQYDRFDIATMLNASDCIECGCCSYVCPSHIPLVQWIKYAKRSIACQI